MMHSLSCIAEEHSDLLRSQWWISHVRDRVAIGAQWNQIGNRIDVVLLSDSGERFQVVDMNEAVCDRPIGFTKIEPACGALASVYGETGDPEERISLVLRQVCFNQRTFFSRDGRRSCVQVHLYREICLVKHFDRWRIRIEFRDGYPSRPSVVVIEVTVFGPLVLGFRAGTGFTRKRIDRRRYPLHLSRRNVPANTVSATLPSDLRLPTTLAPHLHRCSGQKRIGRDVNGFECRPTSRATFNQDRMLISHRNQCSGAVATSAWREIG